MPDKAGHPNFPHTMRNMRINLGSAANTGKQQNAAEKTENVERVDGQRLQLAPPHTGSPGPFGPEKPGRVRKESRKSTPKQGPKSPERVRPGVPKESKTCLLDSFRTLLGLRGALFWDFWGPVSGYSFGTLFGLFRASRARRARETLCGAGPVASQREKTNRRSRKSGRVALSGVALGDVNNSLH